MNSMENTDKTSNLIGLVDVHVHSTFSHDGVDDPQTLYQQAKDLGLGGICLTEHGDYKPQLEHAGYFSYDHFNSTLQEIKNARSDDTPLLLRGLEFSEPHIYPREFSRLNQLDLDMVTGAVHWIEGIFIGKDRLLDKLSEVEFYNRYYDKVMAMVEFGGFDVLSHLHFPARYHGSGSYIQEKLTNILQLIIEKDIVLEINTAVTEKNTSGYYLPEKEVLKLYKQLGGKKVVLGSDAHTREEIAQSFPRVRKLIAELKLTAGYFAQREFQKLYLEEE